MSYEGLLNGALFTQRGLLRCLPLLAFLVLAPPYLVEIACQPEHTLQDEHDAAITPPSTLPCTPPSFIRRAWAPTA